MKLEIKVIPNAKRDEIIERGKEFIVKVTAPPENGKANKSVIKLLSKHFKVKKGEVKIMVGEKSRHKVVEIG